VPELTAIQLAKELGISFAKVHRYKSKGVFPLLDPEAVYNQMFDLDVCREAWTAEVERKRRKVLENSRRYHAKEKERKRKWWREHRSKEARVEQ